MAISRGLCVTGDVQRILPQRNFLENDILLTRPNVADLEGYIDFKIDDIYQTLKTAGYTVPVTLVDSPYGYRFLLYMNAVGAAHMCERIHEGADDLVKDLLDEYNKMEGQVLSHEVILTDIPGAPTQSGLAESETSNLTEAGDEREAFFTREQKF